MEVPDVEVYNTMKDVASMKPTVERVSKFIDNGELDKRIEEAVTSGVEHCPYYNQQRTKNRVMTFLKWTLLLLVPLAVAFITAKQANTRSSEMILEKIELLESKIQSVEQIK